MMDLRGLGLLGAAGAVFLSFHCGGKVVFEATGGASSESTSEATSTASTINSSGSQGTTTVATSTAVSTSSGVPVDCDQLCAAFDEIACQDEGCTGWCTDLLYGECGPELGPFVQCLLEFANSDTTACDAPPQCEMQIAAYLQDHACGEGNCSVAATYGDTTYEVKCNLNGPYACGCYSNGMLLAVCEGGIWKCDVEDGCCSPFFFEG
jgi:hypothetical protein